MTDENPTDAVTAAADLGRRDAERSLDSTMVGPSNVHYVVRLRDDERAAVVNVEGLLRSPLWPRGDADLHDPADFAEYVNRLGAPDSTTVWADPDAGRIVAVFDDHASGEMAGWRQHRATLTLKMDPDWKAWLAADGRQGEQAWFAEHIEELAHTVMSPDAATMLEIAKTFQAKRSVAFRSDLRTDNGDVQLTFEETTKAGAGQKGQMEIPAEFTIRIAPFLGATPADVYARLRYRIVDGRLSIGYALLRPDLVRRDIIAGLVAELRQNVQPFPVLLGTAPAKVSAPELP